jgi:N-glycosylase/DNA lyase
MKHPRSTGDTALLLQSHKESREAIRQRLDDFSRVPADEYFYELIYCLLTPQSSAVNAGKVVAALKELDFEHSGINPEPILSDRTHYIRFHRTKASHLERCKAGYTVIRDKIMGHPEGSELRAWLVENVHGLGWKEASHFLRNIGFRNLAILDRHILRNLVRFGALRRLPATLTPRIYMQIEQKFRTFSERLGIPMDELDLLFWSMETGMILK